MANSCQCPTPPGGVASCESHQLAICRVQNGVASTECHDPPDDADNLALQNWALEVITGTPRSPTQPLSPTEASTLALGAFQNTATGVTTTFAMPKP